MSKSYMENLISSMSPEVESKLVAIGWHRDRRVPITSWSQGLRNDGFDRIPEAEDIMSSFGGLTFRFMRNAETTSYTSIVYFDLDTPGGGSDVDRVLDWQIELKRPINPIGDIENGHAPLIMDATGKVFFGINGSLYLCGETFIDALENYLVLCRREAPLYAKLGGQKEV